MGNRKITFKIDTGAAVTAIPEHFLEGEQVVRAATRLKGAGGHQLEVLRNFCARLMVENKATQEIVYVVRGLLQPLLGKPAIEKLLVLEK